MFCKIDVVIYSLLKLQAELLDFCDVYQRQTQADEQQLLENQRYEALKQEMAELARQRQLAQAKINELRQQERIHQTKQVGNRFKGLM